MRITITKIASDSLIKIGEYIQSEGYPDTALKYIGRVEKFILSLSDYPLKFPVCKRKSFSIKQYHCAVFEKTYVIVYKVLSNEVIILNVVHGKRLG